MKKIKSLLWMLYLNLRGVKGCKNIIVYKSPIINIKKGYIYIHNNVTLHSNKKGYHALMSSATKIFVENRGEIIIGENSRINGACIHARKKILIGKNCLIAAGTSIIDTNGHSINANQRNKNDTPKDIIIQDNVWIGLNCVILKGVTIGKNSVIGANSVISKDVPENTIVKNNNITLEKIDE